VTHHAIEHKPPRTKCRNCWTTFDHEWKDVRGTSTTSFQVECPTCHGPVYIETEQIPPFYMNGIERNNQ